MRGFMELVHGGPLPWQDRQPGPAPENDDGKVSALPDLSKRLPTEPMRRMVRETTDYLLNEQGLLAGKQEMVAAQAAGVVLAVSRILVAVEEVPGAMDFIGAASSLIEGGRSVMDRGLMLRDWDAVVRGAVMLELACRGTCHAIGVPYEATITTVAAGGSVSELMENFKMAKDMVDKGHAEMVAAQSQTKSEPVTTHIYAKCGTAAAEPGTEGASL